MKLLRSVTTFCLLSDEDLEVLKPGWDEWKAVHGGNDYVTQDATMPFYCGRWLLPGTAINWCSVKLR